MSVNLLEDFSNTCRACTCKTQSFQQLNANISKEHTWQVHEMLQLLLPQLSVQLNDALPQQICDLCVNKLEMIYEFQQMCIKSEQEFHQILQENAVEATDALIKQEKFMDMEVELEEQSMHIKLEEETVEIREEEEKATKQPTNVFAIPIQIDEKSVQTSRPFGCTECGKLFKEKHHLAKHKKLHSTERPFACAICSCRFTSKSHLSGHINAEHPNNCTIVGKSMQPSNQYSCTECGKLFNRNSNLTRHMMLHDKERTFVCSICSFPFTDKNDLTSHFIAEHDDDDNKAIKANSYELNRHFEKQTSLAIHFNANRNDSSKEPGRIPDNKLIKCDYCPETHTSMASMHQHLRLQHLNKSFLCTECGKIFTKRLYLLHHMRIHSTERPFKCKKCPQSFKDPSGLHKHRNVHREFNKHQCDICAKTFARSDSLRSHKMTHLGIRPYQCELCDKSFGRISQLTTHRQRHSGEKIHKCKYCSRAFVNSGDLLRHKRLHVDGYLYSCRLCNEKFKYQKEMRTHETTHFAQNEQTDEQQQQQSQEEKKEIVKQQ